jgi:hypothetical protein
MATLTKAMIDDLHKGMTAISLVPYTEGGVVFNNLKFNGADQIFTLKDSFSITPSDPTSEEIKIDQKDQTIDTTVTTGEYKMAGQIPSVAVAVLDYFMNDATTVNTVTGQDGITYKGKSYYIEPREVTCSVLIESASQRTAIAFAKVKFTVPGVTVENASTPAYLAFNADILANAKEGQGDFAVLRDSTLPEPTA